MPKQSVILATVAAMAICVAQAATSEARAQGQAPAALTGQVSSQAEGAMEGVVVSAKKAGSTITISVVSDKDGRYAFPASKLEPGQYGLSGSRCCPGARPGDAVHPFCRNTWQRPIQVHKQRL